MTFGEALELMKTGNRVQRAGWNGAGMFIYLEDWLEGTLKFGRARDRKYEPTIVMFTAQCTHQPGWLASQADMLATDWRVVQ